MTTLTAAVLSGLFLTLAVGRLWMWFKHRGLRRHLWFTESMAAFWGMSLYLPSAVLNIPVPTQILWHVRAVFIVILLSAISNFMQDWRELHDSE